MAAPAVALVSTLLTFAVVYFVVTGSSSPELLRGLSESLAGRGFSARPYHAGLDADIRAQHQRRFVDGEGIVMTATIAVWLVVRDAPPGHPFLARTPESPREMLQGLIEVFRNPRLNHADLL